MQEFYEMFQEEGEKMKKLYKDEKRKIYENQSHASGRTASDNQKSQLLTAANRQKTRRESMRASKTETDLGSNHGSQANLRPEATVINEARDEDEENN